MIASRMLDECIREDKRWVSFRFRLTGKILVEHFLSRHATLRLQEKTEDERLDGVEY